MGRSGRNGARRRGQAGVSALLAAAPVEPLRVGGIIVLVTAILAVQSVEADLVPLQRPPDPEAAADPVLAHVGAARLRVSDLRAQAGPHAGAMPADRLVRDGYLEDAAQQLALAQAAEADGLADALEVRAALALARRRVLSEAYLDLAVSRAVTEEAVRAAYETERERTRALDLVSVRHVLSASREDALAVHRRLTRGERFDRVAARASLDAATKASGGSFGMVSPTALPPEIAAAAASAPIGALVGPFESGVGWHVARVDARRRLAMPGFEARAPLIEAELRASAMRAAAERAEAVARIETAPLTVPGDLAAPPATETAGGAARTGASAGTAQLR